MSPGTLSCPLLQEWEDSEAESVMAAAEAAVKAIRSLRVNYGVQAKQK